MTGGEVKTLGWMELLQLADSALPAGGFAFSNGLESLAKLGQLPSLSAFEAYLQSYLEQVVQGELAFLNSFMRSYRGEDGEPLAIVAEEWNAFLTAPSSRRASLSQGRAWLQLAKVFDPAAETEVRERLSQAGNESQFHFLPVFALVLAALGASGSQVRTLFLHISLRDQISSAIRLGLVGSLQGQALHRNQVNLCVTLERNSESLDFRQAVKSTPLLELAQNHHERLYSRLFQS